MTGWVVIVLLATLVLLALWRFGGFRTAALQFAAAAMLIAMAGYAWQGRPGLPAQPVAAQVRPDRPESAFQALRGEFFGQFTAAERWLILSDSYLRRGNTGEGVAAIKVGIDRNPNDLALWIGLGNALVQHGDGVMSPAAELAYRRAAAIAPDHPATRFFYGMNLIQGGRIDEAGTMWRELLAEGPPGDWRAVVEPRLAILEQIRAFGRGGCRLPRRRFKRERTPRPALRPRPDGVSCRPRR